jgi:hypothetical protein
LSRMLREIRRKEFYLRELPLPPDLLYLPRTHSSSLSFETMGCLISRQETVDQQHQYDNESHSTAKSNDEFIGIQHADSAYGLQPTFKSPTRHNDIRNLGIQPRFRLDISRNSSSDSDSLISSEARHRYMLVQKLGAARVNVQISSDDSSDSQYSNQNSPPPNRIVYKKQSSPCREEFLSSRRENQSIDDVGEDESVVDWLASENGSVQMTIVSEDDETASSPIFAFHMMNADATMSPEQSAPRKLEYVGAYSIEGTNEQQQQHAVKSTERVERQHFSLPKDKPEAKSGDWLSHRYVVNDYIILNEIGRGAFAEVRLCKNKTTNKLFAVKIMSRKAFDPNEVAIMTKLRHPNVLQLHEILDDQRGMTELTLYSPDYSRTLTLHIGSQQDLSRRRLPKARRPNGLG